MNYPTFNETTYHLLLEKSKLKNFFFREFDINDKKFIVFYYRSSSPLHFRDEYKREMRGSMFEITKGGKYMRPICRPFEKFFSIEQITYHKQLDHLSQFYGKIDIKYPLTCYEKVDGSLIASFMIDDKLYFKTNKELYSSIIDNAMQLLKQNTHLYQKTYEWTKNGYTVLFEYVSPNENMIIVEYLEQKLTVLGIRHIINGSYINYNIIVNEMGEEHVVKKRPDIFTNLKNIQNVEGVVCVYSNEFRIKYKTQWYKDIEEQRYKKQEAKKQQQIDLSNRQKRIFKSFIHSIKNSNGLNEEEEKIRNYFDQLSTSLAQKIINNQPLVTKEVIIKELYNKINENKLYDKHKFSLDEFGISLYLSLIKSHRTELIQFLLNIVLPHHS